MRHDSMCILYVVWAAFTLLDHWERRDWPDWPDGLIGSKQAFCVCGIWFLALHRLNPCRPNEKEVIATMIAPSHICRFHCPCDGEIDAPVNHWTFMARKQQFHPLHKRFISDECNLTFPQAELNLKNWITFFNIFQTWKFSKQAPIRQGEYNPWNEKYRG
jgi:hypothetical protein